MEIRENDSTINRPFGKRPIDAPFIPLDLHAYAQQLMLEEAWQKNDRNAITLFKSEGTTLVLVALHKDAEMIPGNFEGTGILLLQVLDGLLHFSTEGEELDINRGQMITLHENRPYKALAHEETICLLTMVRGE
jgi:hypothetical protein